MNGENWQVAFSCNARKGKTIDVQPRPCPMLSAFIGELLIATNSYKNPGYGTVIQRVLIGNRTQPFPGGPTVMYHPEYAVRTRFTMDKCIPSDIRIRVKFLETCRWDATLFGQAYVGSNYKWIDR